MRAATMERPRGEPPPRRDRDAEYPPPGPSAIDWSESRLSALPFARAALQSTYGAASWHRVSSLNVSRNALLKLSGMHLLPRLEHLDASANRLVTLGDLGRTNPGLLSLDASDNSLVSIAGLRGCKALTRLSLRNNNIRDVDVATTRELRALETLDLSRNALESLGDLAGCVRLATLDLSRNAIASLRGAAWKLPPSLRALNLGVNDVVDVAEARHLAACPRLVWLVLRGCPLEEIARMVRFDHRAVVAFALPRLVALDGEATSVAPWAAVARATLFRNDRGELCADLLRLLNPEEDGTSTVARASRGLHAYLASAAPSPSPATTGPEGVARSPGEEATATASAARTDLSAAAALVEDGLYKGGGGARTRFGLTSGPDAGPRGGSMYTTSAFVSVDMWEPAPEVPPTPEAGEDLARRRRRRERTVSPSPSSPSSSEATTTTTPAQSARKTKEKEGDDIDREDVDDVRAAFALAVRRTPPTTAAAIEPRAASALERREMDAARVATGAAARAAIAEREASALREKLRRAEEDRARLEREAKDAELQRVNYARAASVDSGGVSETDAFEGTAGGHRSAYAFASAPDTALGAAAYEVETPSASPQVMKTHASRLLLPQSERGEDDDDDDDDDDAPDSAAASESLRSASILGESFRLDVPGDLARGDAYANDLIFELGLTPLAATATGAFSPPPPTPPTPGLSPLPLDVLDLGANATPASTQSQRARLAAARRARTMSRDLDVGSALREEAATPASRPGGLSPTQIAKLTGAKHPFDGGGERVRSPDENRAPSSSPDDGNKDKAVREWLFSPERKRADGESSSTPWDEESLLSSVSGERAVAVAVAATAPATVDAARLTGAPAGPSPGATAAARVLTGMKTSADADAAQDAALERLFEAADDDEDDDEEEEDEDEDEDDEDTRESREYDDERSDALSDLPDPSQFRLSVASQRSWSAAMAASSEGGDSGGTATGQGPGTEYTSDDGDASQYSLPNADQWLKSATVEYNLTKLARGAGEIVDKAAAAAAAAEENQIQKDPSPKPPPAPSDRARADDLRARIERLRAIERKEHRGVVVADFDFDFDDDDSDATSGVSMPSLSASAAAFRVAAETSDDSADVSDVFPGTTPDQWMRSAAAQRSWGVGLAGIESGGGLPPTPDVPRRGVAAAAATTATAAETSGEIEAAETSSDLGSIRVVSPRGGASGSTRAKKKKKKGRR